MGRFKINFKDSACKYVEDYNAGKYGTKVKIYFCEGDAVTPKGYSGSVGAKTITAETIEDLKKKLDEAVVKRDKEIEKSLSDSKKAKDSKKKVKDKWYVSYFPETGDKVRIKTYLDRRFIESDEDYNERKAHAGEEGVLDSVFNNESVAWVKFKNGDSVEFKTWEFEPIAKKPKLYDSKKKVKDGKGCVGCKDSYDDLADEWDYDINCEGNQWADGGFETLEEAEDEALATVNELLEDFPEGYAVDDFDITFRNSVTGETYTYDPYYVKDCNMATLTPGKVNLKRASKKFNQRDCGLKDSALTRYAQTDEQEETLNKIEKVAKSLDFSIRFGTTVGKSPQSIILDHGYQDSLIRVSANGACEIGDIEIGSWRDDYCEPEISEIREAIKKQKEKKAKDSKSIKSKDKKFCDASAEDIIDLFEEAYIKGRSWDWLKSKLPSKFLNMQNKHWKSIFPIQADRTGKLEGVYLTKPKNYTDTEDFKDKLDKFVDNLDYYISYVQHLDSDYGIETDTYNFDKIRSSIRQAIEDTDSKKQSEELTQTLKNIDGIYDDLRQSAYRFNNITIWGKELDNLVDVYSKGENALRRYVINRENDSRSNRDYKENQKKPIVYNREGGLIRSDSKVGPLSEEAKSYIRRVMKGSTTEEMESKRESRQANKPGWLGWEIGSGYKNDVINNYRNEVYELKNLLRDLKSEANKEKSLGIEIHPKRPKTKWVGYNNGGYNAYGNWEGYGRNKGGYQLTNESYPNTVSLNIQGLKSLEQALNSVVGAKTLDDMQEGLTNALEVIKGLPRSNPKVAELKASIKNLLENRKNASRVRRPLPDKKFVKDSFNGKELKEYMELCKKLGLLTQGDVQNFSKKHGNVTDKKLLEELRKEANKK